MLKNILLPLVLLTSCISYSSDDSASETIKYFAGQRFMAQYLDSMQQDYATMTTEELLEVVDNAQLIYNKMVNTRGTGTAATTSASSVTSTSTSRQYKKIPDTGCTIL